LHRQPHFATQTRKRAREEEPNGSFLTNPQTDKLNCENVEVHGLEVGHASMQGYRVSMEDEHVIEPLELPKHLLLAIMDGHAGKFSAKYVARELRHTLEATEQWAAYCKLSPLDREKAPALGLVSQALVQAYTDLDADLRLMDAKGLMDESGTTAVCAVVTPSHVICASVGDSRCVVGSTRTGSTTALSEDHKPSNPEERVRIEAAGGFVLSDRVNGELAMSRALGDFRYKRDPALLSKPKEQQVICFPDVAVHKRSGKKDEILILACDGVWDVVSNAESVAYLADIVLRDDFRAKKAEAERISAKHNGKNKKNKEGAVAGVHVTAQEAAESLIELAFTDGSTDNISAICVKYL